MEDTRNSKRIELAFPKFDEQDIAKGPGDDIIGWFSTSIDEIRGWFSGYEIDTIELWISGVIESSGITKFVVNAKGEGGLKIVLKPNARK